jgi:large subunit ribosomal protein L23
MDDPRDVIVRPVVSEKSYALSEKGVYIFVVPSSTNKIEIRRSVEKVFNVKVTNVNTLNRLGKRKRNRKKSTYTKQSDTKRAFVTLAAGQTIPLFETS